VVLEGRLVAHLAISPFRTSSRSKTAWL